MWWELSLERFPGELKPKWCCVDDDCGGWWWWWWCLFIKIGNYEVDDAQNSKQASEYIDWNMEVLRSKGVSQLKIASCSFAYWLQCKEMVKLKAEKPTEWGWGGLWPIDFAWAHWNSFRFKHDVGGLLHGTWVCFVCDLIWYCMWHWLKGNLGSRNKPNARNLHSARALAHTGGLRYEEFTCARVQTRARAHACKGEIRVEHYHQMFEQFAVAVGCCCNLYQMIAILLVIFFGVAPTFRDFIRLWQRISIFELYVCLWMNIYYVSVWKSGFKWCVSVWKCIFDFCDQRLK